MRDWFDVFCSYARADEEAVGRQVRALEAHGVAVYLDRAEIADFDGITAYIKRGLERSKALLAYYSATYPTRAPCQWELTAAFLAAQREGDPRRRVLVVNPESAADHIEPVELRDAVYCHVSDTGDEQALARSVAAHVASLDGLLGEVRPLAPPVWYPHLRTGSSRFVGRLSEMWAVHTALHGSDVGLITDAVSAVAQVRGLGGIGKSLLAEEYALRFGAAFPGGVFWLRGFGDGDGSLDPEQREAERQRQIEAFAAEVGIDVSGLSPDAVEGALGRWLEEQGQPCLWVVDDLPSGLDGGLRRWLAPHPLARTLITTRSREYDAVGGRVDLGGLPEREAEELLIKRRQPADHRERAAAATITAALGYHPLALDVAGAALRYEPFESFLGALQEPSTDWFEELTAKLRDALPNGHERSVARTLMHSIDRLGEAGRDLLRLASVLAAAPVSAELVGAVLARVDDLDDRSAALRRGQALDDAEALCLAEPAGDLRWRVHELVSRTVRFADPLPERRAALRRVAIATLTDALEATVNASAPVDTGDVVPHARELIQRPDEREALDLLSWVALFDYQRGDYESAEVLNRAGYEARRKLLGDEDPATLTSLDNRAVVLTERGYLADARTLHERALDARRRALGDEHPDTITSLGNLASTLHAQGDLAGASSLYERGLELLGAGHVNSLRMLNNLAVTLSAQGDVAGAQRVHERVFDILRETLGDDHPDTLSSLGNVASTYRAAGDLAIARGLQERVLEASRRVLGDEHPNTLTAMNNLAETRRAQGDLTGAQAIHEEAFALLRRTLGDDHPHTLSSLNSLAGTLREQGELDAAFALHERAYIARRRLLGDEHPDTLSSLTGLGLTFKAKGDFAGARTFLGRAYEGRARVLGPDHPSTLSVLQQLCSLPDGGSEPSDEIPTS